eukprot:1577074-Pleurochrysis_carterae.AAC.2
MAPPPKRARVSVREPPSADDADDATRHALQARSRTRTCGRMHTRTRAHARAHAYMRAHAHARARARVPQRVGGGTDGGRMECCAVRI